MHSLLTVTYLGPNLQNILRQSYDYLTIDLRQLSNLQLEGKYSLESTDPCESEIRAPPQPLPYLMPIPPNTLFYNK